MPLLVVLKVPSQQLKKFPHEAPPKPTSSSSKSKSTKSSEDEKPTIAVADSAAEASVATPQSDSNSSTLPQSTTNPDLLAPPPNATKRKGVPGPKPGMKRASSQLDVNGEPKPRGKPGPKKKQRLGEPADGTPLPTVPAGPKLGPKANTGAINEKLRALDRTGEFKARKWVRKGFTVKSFTGVLWSAPTSWSAPERPRPLEDAGAAGEGFPGDVKSESSNNEGLENGSRIKESSGGLPQGSSAPPSEKSQSVVDGGTPGRANGDTTAAGTPIAA